MPQTSMIKICLKITYLKLHSNFPGANELSLVYQEEGFQYLCHFNMEEWHKKEMDVFISLRTGNSVNG